ncbi:hypothetical protein [Elizabethkingia anophelis]|uniref:hypothetical protein n=1 Tax=Elizabethkingia anophelis TaxID=1117645 RepID=UPI000668D819|nr:hypothetical protein [Elizabethkingia anophelis]AQW89712.1 hypothetical protein BBD28_03140 [Elizabethkingia anophelis]KUY16310.1 hypothetical protein ATB94_05665 [Elizabethkingia anophelis]
MITNRFRSWQNSVDIDYLSLYMKTWFAFLSTIHELHPEAINESGDRSVISVYKEHVGIPAKFVDVMLPHIHKVFAIGDSIIQQDIPNSYFVNFYNVNKTYLLDKECTLSKYKMVDSQRVYFKSFIKIEYKDKINGFSNPNLLFTIKSDQPKFLENLACHHLTLNIELSKFIDEIGSDGVTRIFKSKDECLILIENLLRNALHQKVNEIVGLEEDEREERKGYCNGLLIPLILVLRQEFTNDDIFNHLPLKGFPDSYNIESNKIKILNWFISFNYQIRNLLFHSLIDPFNPQWLKVFKHAYLSLKELVEHNIEKIETQLENQ